MTVGSPLFAALITSSSSGTIPIKSIFNTCRISSMSSISPVLTRPGRIRLTTSFGDSTCDCSKRPIIRSASRTAACSGVVTTMALSAPAMALRKPCSIPAGQSIRMYSYSFLSSRIISFTCSGVTEVLSLVWAAGSMYSSSKRLSLTSA
ncbi:hypothetical protein D3C75_949600 [compost metagenome]